MHPVPGPWNRAVRRFGAALLLLGALAGCRALAPHFEKPTLSVVGVELQSAQLLTQRFRVRVRVVNPNNRELPVESVRFTVELDGDRLGAGATAAPFTIPAQGEGEFDAFVNTDLATALVKVLPKLRDGAPPVEYRITGEVGTALPFLRTIPFDQQGRYSLSQHVP